VAFYTVNGGGHQYPSIAHDPRRLDFGPQNRDIEGAVEIWNFLKIHRLGGAFAVPAVSPGWLGFLGALLVAVVVRFVRMGAR